MGRGDHLRARKRGRHLRQIEPDKLRHEEKQPAAAGRERARLKRKSPGIGHRLHRRPRIIGSLFIQAPGKRGESLLLQHLPHGGRTQGAALVLQGLTDLINRIVLLAEADDRLSGGRLLGLSPGAVPGRDEKQRFRIVAEMMAQDMERAEGIAEGAGDLLSGAALGEVGSQSLVHAVFGVTGLEEEAPVI